MQCQEKRRATVLRRTTARYGIRRLVTVLLPDVDVLLQAEAFGGELLDVVVPAFLHAAVLHECGQLVHREVIDSGTIIGQRLVVFLGRVNPDRDDFLLGIHVGQGVAAGLVAGGDLIGVRVVLIIVTLSGM